MLDHLITSKTRIRLLIKFFVYEEMEAYLRELTKEFGDATNAVRVELTRLTEAGLLIRSEVKNRKMYRANTKHPHFADIQYIVRRYIKWYNFQQTYLDKGSTLEAIYLLEDAARTSQYEYILLHPEDASKVASYNADALRIRVLENKDIEKLQGKNIPCFCIWRKQFGT
ncbi:hypothetical protein [Bacillus piscicola]|uniref:hypothetical protein n=1 Tax=Bacillus piscicola TaxID=1632684 RepID=UPI001F088FCC|nr:hypothetical protein [Bacillus piscicola]